MLDVPYQLGAYFKDPIRGKFAAWQAKR